MSVQERIPSCFIQCTIPLGIHVFLSSASRLISLHFFTAERLISAKTGELQRVTKKADDIKTMKKNDKDNHFCRGKGFNHLGDTIFCLREKRKHFCPAGYDESWTRAIEEENFLPGQLNWSWRSIWMWPLAAVHDPWPANGSIFMWFAWLISSLAALCTPLRQKKKAPHFQNFRKESLFPGLWKTYFSGINERKLWQIKTGGKFAHKKSSPLPPSGFLWHFSAKYFCSLSHQITKFGSFIEKHKRNGEKSQKIPPFDVSYFTLFSSPIKERKVFSSTSLFLYSIAWTLSVGIRSGCQGRLSLPLRFKEFIRLVRTQKQWSDL